MDEVEALERLRKKDEAALVWLIERYAPYVNTVIYNIIGTVASPCDVEEVSSDVFLVLWQNADTVQEGKLKAYLGAVARNKAREKLRSLGGSSHWRKMCSPSPIWNMTWRSGSRRSWCVRQWRLCLWRTGRFSCGTTTIFSRWPASLRN